MTCTLTSHGGAGEVTGSKHILRAGPIEIMIDCGAFQGRRKESDQKNRHWTFSPRNLDAVLLTHAHFDHCGLLPMLTRRGFEQNIYATPATRDLASLILLDSAHIQAKDLAYLAKHKKNHDPSIERTPLYTEDDVHRIMSHFMTVAYGRSFQAAQGMSARFYDAGHILGSAMAVVQVENPGGEPFSIAFTGDLGRKGQPIIRDPEILPAVDYLVLESTYGNRLHKPVEATMDLLAEAISSTYARGGKIIIPAFAVERTQELIYFIHLLVDQHRIPRLPIFVDSPMAVNATSIFRVHEDCYDAETRQAFIDHNQNPFGFNDLKTITRKEESQALNELNEPAIIISASGMCESGRILHHLMHNITDPRNTVLIVGYMAENTLGRRILEKEPEVRIFGDTYPLKAEVKVLNSFSGHADYNEIISYLGAVDTSRLKQIFLVHGETQAQQNLQKLLGDLGYPVKIVEAATPYSLQ